MAPADHRPRHQRPGPPLRLVPHNYQLGFYTEQYLATQFLGHGDVFDRYPELRSSSATAAAASAVPQDGPATAENDTRKNLFFDTCAYDPVFLEAASSSARDRMVFGTEAPGSGRHVIPETGLSGDNLVPVIDSYTFLSEADKLAILNGNPKKVIPALTKWEARQAVTA